MNRMDLAQKEASPSERVIALNNALSILCTTSSWPLTRQPYASARQQLIVALLDTAQYNAALAQATVQHLYIDPVLFPEPHHPIRLVHKWVMYRLMTYMLSEPESAHQQAELKRYALHLGLLANDLLGQLKENTTDGSTNFDTMVNSEWSHVHEGLEQHFGRATPEMMAKEVSCDAYYSTDDPIPSPGFGLAS